MLAMFILLTMCATLPCEVHLLAPAQGELHASNDRCHVVTALLLYSQVPLVQHRAYCMTQKPWQN